VTGVERRNPQGTLRLPNFREPDIDCIGKRSDVELAIALSNVCLQGRRIVELGKIHRSGGGA
jgi:hypothetical protein